MKSKGQIFIFSILKTFTRELFLTFCLLFPGVCSVSQIAEDFSDNELTENPLWTGNTDHFNVESGVLMLRAPADAGRSYLSTSNSVAAQASWECTVRLAFNPSSSNYCRFYLTSDHHDLGDDLNGYFVQVGGADDDVSLFRQDLSAITKIIDGTDGLLNKGENGLRIRATRSYQGTWNLFTRAENAEDFTLEGQATDAIFMTSVASGFQCVFTATRADKFSFDDVMVTALEDNEPPKIKSIDAETEHTVKVEFTEPMEKSSVENTLHYETTAGTLSKVTQDGDNAAVARLHFASALSPWLPHTIIIHDVRDLAGNVVEQDTGIFQYSPAVEVAFKDVLITEIMADPDPGVGLPAAEFVELFNRTSNPINLSGWTISDGGPPGTLSGDHLLPANGYVILTTTSSAELFIPFGSVAGVSRFPSLNNNGDYVIIRDHTGKTIDSIQYQNTWSKETEKREGGWSLEIVDPENLCEGSDNWDASEDPSGGTPGRLNSIDAENPDLDGPRLILSRAVLPDTVRLMFSESLNHDLPDSQSFLFSPHREVIGVRTDLSRLRVDLVVSPALIAGEIMSISLKNISDCAGNELEEEDRHATVILPQNADSLDVVINEILFNPGSGGVDFVEVINASAKYVDLTGWTLSNFTDSQPGNSKSLSNLNLILAPGDIAAFTSDRSILLSNYPHANENRVFQCELPPLNDLSGSIAIRNDDKKVIDAMFYYEDMHSVFLKDREGVSLERISAGAPSGNPDNWHSASAQSGYATPGSVNSNAHGDIPGLGGEVSLQPEIFSPLMGQQNFTLIGYQFGMSGFVGSVAIFDQQSRRVKTIAENVLLGTSGFFRWDGDRDDGSKASVGNYQVRFEVYNSGGVVKTIRRRVAVAGRF